MVPPADLAGAGVLAEVCVPGESPVAARPGVARGDHVHLAGQPLPGRPLQSIPAEERPALAARQLPGARRPVLAPGAGLRAAAPVVAPPLPAADVAVAAGA